MTEAQLQAADAELALFTMVPDLTVMRQCPTCGESKPLATAFRKRYDDGGIRYRAVCRRCQYASEKEWRDAQGIEYRRKCNQWQLYRLPWNDYLEIFDRQEGACAICRERFGDNPKLIDVDHDHKCDHPGKGTKCCRACVRGLLCHRCNIFVGWVENEHRRLPGVLAYLGVNGVIIGAQIMRDLSREPAQMGG